MTVDWNAIRPINGSQAAGFEALCTQLAEAESPIDSKFIRKGTPDAGIECYTTLTDGSEWGWQSKFFDTLTDSQFSQLDRSVSTALEKHPRLERLYICIPLDRPDGRVDRQGRPDGRIIRQKSALDRWNEHVLKWGGWARERGMDVNFIYWGSHELLTRLTRDEHVGRVKFFFNARIFNRPWFSTRLDEAIQSAGPRYTPKIHVDLPIAANFEAFGRTERFFDQIKANARQIRESLQSFRYSESKASVIEERYTPILIAQAKEIIAELGFVNPGPIEDLPFLRIVDLITSAEDSVEAIMRWLSDREQEYDTTPGQREPNSIPEEYKINPFRDRRHYLIRLSRALRETRESLMDANDIAGAVLLLLKGDAGTGKTHLLCDVARQRIEENRPTVLLMGQLFTSTETPWTQVLQQLDLASLTAEEFTRTLEAAAQAAGCRALVMIDALNEGLGRQIWPRHLSAFLAPLLRSPWIAVVLSVRSSYEKLVIPVEVRDRAISITHEGFKDHEYDAARIFFSAYDLEFPSTPLLAPEFSIPLFLKTLCQGLKKRGERRFPRGFIGITAIFDLYLDAVNNYLANELDYDPRDALVKNALEAFAKSSVDTGMPWLPGVKAKEAVNAILPGREFERSLYRRLITEGLLISEIIWHSETKSEEIITFAYERFGDHLVAKVLLDRYLDPIDHSSCFVEGGRLSFLCNEREYVSLGLLEAICVQTPERTGKELVLIAPGIENRWGIGDVFRRSLIWRDIAAYSEETRVVINKLTRSEHDRDDTIEMFLTLAALPDHPYNAGFLDQRLRRDSMPERDAWWSLYLNRTWGTRGAVDRLIDWATTVTPDAPIDEETIDLCAITLSWMLTASNRYLRDRATKALVSLLSGRLKAVTRLVKLFADVDDPYVAERIYAVAYGTAMRSQDPVEIGILAQSVYNLVFANNTPPVHILLRDYARGVVERAVSLEANVEIILENIRPPYISEWPTIPTEMDIEPYLPDWSHGSWDSRSLEWARNAIGSSVMHGDFASYIIGTNYGSKASRYWLSLRLDEPPWQSPNTCLLELIDDFSESEGQAWLAFKESDELVEHLSPPLWVSLVSDEDLEAIFEEASDISEDRIIKNNGEHQEELERAAQGRDARFIELESALTEEHALRLKEILTDKENDDKRNPPGFDLRLIQRYILRRVFDLGWTTERFAKFDRIWARSFEHEFTRAERIGKKYQWIAYHEILAFVADHFQFLEDHLRDPGDHAYDGPWQCHLRDIDPSCVLQAAQGGTSWDGHSLAWWGPARYDDWGDPRRVEDWIAQREDLPKIQDLLVTENPGDKSRWINGHGFLLWIQRPPPDQEPTDVDRRELWYRLTAFLVPSKDTDSLMEWARTVNLKGQRIPSPPDIPYVFLGEHGWSHAFKHFQRQYYQDYGDDGYTPLGEDCPVKVRVVGVEYNAKMDDLDQSIDDNFHLQFPISELITKLGLQWSGYAANYIDLSGRLAVFDPTIFEEGPKALLFREDLLREFLIRENLTLCWVVQGEKQVLPGNFNPRILSRQDIAAIFLLQETGVNGFINPTTQGLELPIRD